MYVIIPVVAGICTVVAIPLLLVHVKKWQLGADVSFEDALGSAVDGDIDMSSRADDGFGADTHGHHSGGHHPAGGHHDSGGHHGGDFGGHGGGDFGGGGGHH